jgi:GTPase SAR1 family protein
MEASGDGYDCFKISLLGNSATGKTSICNRLVNNYFPVMYNPTVEVDTYRLFFDISEISTKKKHCFILIEDVFGLNNPLLTTIDAITCKDQKIMKEEMTKKFKDIMFTSSTKKDNKNSSNKKEDQDKNKKLSKKEILTKICKKENDDYPRKGFVFVCDASDQSSVDDIIFTIDKLSEIEKTSNMEMKYPKLILINKKDKVDSVNIDKKKKEINDNLNGKKINYRIQEVSALTNEGIVDSFKAFMATIQQLDVESKQNNGYQENLDDEDDDENNTVN